MASHSGHRPSSSSQLTSSGHESSRRSTSFVELNAKDYDEDDIQVLWKIVVAAEDALRDLPERWRTPKQALFQQYYVILPKYGIDTNGECKMANFLFQMEKLGEGQSMRDRFQEIVSDLGFTLEIDGRQVDVTSSRPSSSEEEISQESDYPETTGNEPTASHTKGSPDQYVEDTTTDTDALERQTATVGSDEPSGLNFEVVTYDSREDHGDLPDALDRLASAFAAKRSQAVALGGFNKLRQAAANARKQHEESDRSKEDAVSLSDSFIDDMLESRANAFRQLHDRQSALNGFRRFQEAALEKASEMDEMQEIVEQFDVAREMDFKADNLEHKLSGWRNRCRIERIACRTHEIYIGQKVLVQWRARAGEQCQKEQEMELRSSRRQHYRPEKSDAELENEAQEKASAEAERLIRIARLASEYNAKSKCFAQWANKARLEVERSEASLEAAETARKSRTLGLQHRLEDLALALRQKMQGYLGTAQVDIPEPATAHTQATQPGVETTTGSLVIPETSNQQTMPQSSLEQTPIPLETVGPLDATADSFDLSKEDERTLLARRHILRMRFFGAWKNYTAEHTTRAKDFAQQKGFEAWRERADLPARAVEFAEIRQNRFLRATVRGLVDKMSEKERFEAQAVAAEKRHKLDHALKPWLAASRERANKRRKLVNHFGEWFRTTDRDAQLGVFADRLKMWHDYRGTMSEWSTKAGVSEERNGTLQRYAQEGDYYRRTHGTLQVWKVKSRQKVIQYSMKQEALKKMRERWLEQRPHPLQLEEYAERAEFYIKVSKTLPKWRAAAGKVAQRQGQGKEYAQRADYYYRTHNTLTMWNVLAKRKRKESLKEAYLNARRRIKKGMGERHIAEWRKRTGQMYQDHTEMNVLIEEVIADRDWRLKALAIDVWRQRAEEKQQMAWISEATSKQKALDLWKEQSDDQQELQLEASEHWQGRALSRGFKQWNLSSLQNESRRHTAASIMHQKKERKLLRSHLQRWYDTTTDQLPTVSKLGADTGSRSEAPQDSRHQEAQSRARDIFASWRASTKEQTPPVEEEEEEEEEGLEQERQQEQDDEAYAPTPGRPQLLLGSFGRGQSMTPLAPVPVRPEWQRSSIMRGRSSRRGRSRGNMRVSWQE